MEAEADCLEKKKILRKHERRISEDEEADCLEKRNGVTWERYHSGSENAARCMCWRSTLHRLAQRAASAIAPHCVFRLPLLLLVPRRHRHLRQAPLSSPARAPGIIGRGCKKEAPSCSFPVWKVQEGALLYPVTLHSSASISQRKGAGWSGHSVGGSLHAECEAPGRELHAGTREEAGYGAIGCQLAGRPDAQSLAVHQPELVTQL